MIKVRVTGLPIDDPELLELLAAAECEVVGEPALEADEQAADADAALDEEHLDEAILRDGEMYDTNDGKKGVANDNPDCEAVIVVLGDECPDSDALKTIVMRAVAVGCKVIGVWPRGCTDGRVPEALERLGDGVVVWDPACIYRALTGHEPQWQVPSGEHRPKPKTVRNSC